MLLDSPEKLADLPAGILGQEDFHPIATSCVSTPYTHYVPLTFHAILASRSRSTADTLLKLPASSQFLMPSRVVLQAFLLGSPT
jgi:hypothetical protein